MGYPKALLRLGGSTYLETIAQAYRKAGIQTVLAVTHEGVAKHPDFPILKGVDLLVLKNPTESPLETLWFALEQIEGRWAAFFMHPVDHPFVRSETLKSMAALYKKKKPCIIQPRHLNRGGHPVLMDLILNEEIRAASPSLGLRQVVRADPDRIFFFSVDDPGVLKGVNHPSDLPMNKE
jgi:CTP:molybdopterin cytidylyltransferase MocA